MTNYDNKDDDVMVFASVSALTLCLVLSEKGKTSTEIYLVKDEELQYYVYEPLWLNEKEFDNIEQLAAQFVKKNYGTPMYNGNKAKCSK